MSSEKDLPVAEMENTTQSTDNDKTEGEEVEREVITSDEGKECLNEGEHFGFVTTLALQLAKI